MGTLDEYIIEANLDRELAVELRDYFHFRKANFRQTFYQHILELMSPTLRSAVSRHLHSAWCRQIWFFNADDQHERSRFIDRISMALELETFAPDEVLYDVGDPSTKMYIIRRGLVGVGGAPRGVGRFFGEDCLATLESGDGGRSAAAWRRPAPARAMTYLDVNALSNVAVRAILAGGAFAETRRLLKRHAILSRFQRMMNRLVLGLRLSPGYARLTKDEITYWKTELRRRGSSRRLKAGAQAEEGGAAEEHLNSLHHRVKETLELPDETDAAVTGALEDSAPTVEDKVDALSARLAALQGAVEGGELRSARIEASVAEMRALLLEAVAHKGAEGSGGARR